MKTKYWIILAVLFGVAIVLWGIVALIILSHLPQTGTTQAPEATAIIDIAPTVRASEPISFILEAESDCPISDVPSGFTSTKCYLINSTYNVYGLLSFKSNGDLGSIGIYYYYDAPQSVYDKMASFIIEAASAYGWNIDDVNKLANELPLTTQGNVLTSGDIYASYAVQGKFNIEVFMRR